MQLHRTSIVVLKRFDGTDRKIRSDEAVGIRTIKRFLYPIPQTLELPLSLATKPLFYILSNA